LANHPFQTRTRELQKRLKTSAVSFSFLSFSLQVALFRNGKILRSLAAVQVRKGIFCDAILYYK
jgi:hypothetical protein